MDQIGVISLPASPRLRRTSRLTGRLCKDPKGAWWEARRLRPGPRRRSCQVARTRDFMLATGASPWKRMCAKRKSPRRGRLMAGDVVSFPHARRTMFNWVTLENESARRASLLCGACYHGLAPVATMRNPDRASSPPPTLSVVPMYPEAGSGLQHRDYPRRAVFEPCRDLHYGCVVLYALPAGGAVQAKRALLRLRHPDHSALAGVLSLLAKPLMARMLLVQTWSM